MALPRIIDNNRGRDIAYVAALGVGQAALLMAAAFATRIVFSALAEGGAMPVAAIAALIAVPLCLAMVQAVARVLAEKIGQSFAIDLRETVFRSIAGLPEDERAKRSLGGLSLRFVGDMSAARGWAGLGVTRAISGVIVLPAAAATLWVLNPSLALAGMVPILLSMLLFVLIGLRLKKVHKRLRKRRAGVAIWAMERIGKAHELAAMGRLDRECGQLRKRGARAADDAVTRIRTTSTLRMIPNASLGLGSAAVLVTALHLGLPTGEAAAALAVLAILTIPLHQLVGVWDKHAAWKIARKKCLILMDKAQAPHPLTSDSVRVTLSHPDWSDPLVIDKGQALQLSPDQQGSAAFAALLGQDSPVGVSFDGAAEPEQACVGTNPVILKGSLRRALTMGLRKRPSDAALRDLAQRLGLDTDLEERLAENGADVPDADRLRISIAQAVLRDPALILVSDDLWSDPQGHDLWDLLQAQTTSTIVAAPRRETFIHDKVA